LLDSDLNLVPIGIPGELHIGGIGVARGYHNRPELTAGRFIPNLFLKTEASKPPHLLYKSGDLARYLPDGNIEYLGRRDGQIKLRGVRMELGEIEAALMNHPAIRQAVVVHRKEISEEGVLVAYLVGEEDCPPELTQKLPTFLKSKLPEVMVPAMFVSIEALPLTPSGKLDRRTLPQPERLGSTERVAPRNETERAIASIWSTVLPIETTRQDISIYDNFFDLGGHSLSATRVNTRLRKHFDIPLPLQSSFEHPTVESLATHIDALKITTNIQPNIQLSAGHKEIEL
ncbi:MAG: phosphopantetheine-binding protein, partial [Cyanobacteria bacterium J06576_12]